MLERKNARLEKELEEKDIKAGFFDLMIDIAEEEYGVQIRKDTAGPFLPRDNELPPQVPQAQEPHCRHGGDKARAGLCLWHHLYQEPWAAHGTQPSAFLDEESRQGIRIYI